MLVSSNLKEFADNNFKFDKNGRKFSIWVENTVGKGEIARYVMYCLYEQLNLLPHNENTVGKGEIAHNDNFSFSHSVFKRLVQETRKNQGLFGNGLTFYITIPDF